MKKKDLKVGYLVELRNGKRYLVMPVNGDDGVDLELVTKDSVRPLDWYDDNLVCTRMSFSCPYTKKEMDIMYDNDTIYGINNQGDLVLDYFYEDKDQLGDAYVFNGATSTL